MYNIIIISERGIIHMANKRAGFLLKQLSGDITYFSFSPSKLSPNPPIDMDKEMIELLVKAHKILSVLDDRGKNIPDMDLFISMYVQKEALLSSQIEGTQATLEDIFDPDIDENINADINDVVNYTRATKYAIDRLKEFPLCNRLLLETHKVLLSGIRGQEKNPGEFRHSQNWIGGLGSNIKTARYIPPDVNTMNQALSDLEKYINFEDELDILINAGLIHYQFETIHPFLDGNGRIGRLLVVLYLLNKGIISTPSLYLSYYLKEHRIEYYDRMSAVRETGNYEQWLKFFIEGIYVSGKSAIETADKLIALRKKNHSLIEGASYTKRTLETMKKVFTYLESHPIIDIGKTSLDLQLSYNTIASSIERFEKLGILSLAEMKDRNRIYIYKEYLDLLKSGTETFV